MFKHMLPATFARAPAEAQGWIPRTWNLETEAAEVVWEFEQRRKKGQVGATARVVMRSLPLIDAVA